MALCESLRVGGESLERTGAALSAVEAAVRLLEDSELFNAGRGAHPTRIGTIEMDAAVMDGRDRRAGAVAAVQRVRYPISAARAVLEDGAHVLLVGEGADAFAAEVGLELIDPAELVAAARDRAESVHGTVGAVARDPEGHLAVATSTGGRRGQRAGRVGDTPLIGAGTWADDECAVSGTGHGELYVRTVFAHEVAARVRHGGLSLARAVAAGLQQIRELRGEGGCIALGPRGDPVLEHSTDAMPRGALGPGRAPAVALYAGEVLAPLA